MQHRILIVDDNPTNVDLLEDILADEYPGVLTASSGEEALEVASTCHPHLILLDIMMPGIDGYETCRRIRAHAALRHTKVIMLSAKAMVSERLQGYEAGADDYITKPFDEEEFLAKVRVYLQLKSLQEVEQLTSDLFTLLNHETRTPLNGIIPPLEMLCSGDIEAPEDRNSLLDIALQSAKRLLNLFEKVMALSSMKAEQWEFDLEPVLVAEVVHRAVSTVSAKAIERNVQMTSQLPEAVITMLDREQMQHAITALLTHAIYLSPPGACVVVDFSCEDRHLVLTVTDQGEGIDPEALPHVFEAFFQSDVRPHNEGLGLDMAIARQIVLAHNGAIDVVSTKGVGTTFTVRLPVVVPADDDGGSSVPVRREV